eukprot:CAMPEP_0184691766 /NCGR_PEP_ID=MMETSP0313-20130426/504_1 /TAXON_ID=2792 /ORGANISM="Porphyridium aerugineum, Strain SAG 1380-2" /LENGTH=270 /DNA_ID=CAMNT_0027149527 /DNA_START=311 /DNA_END=1123 /DNA_ORIENTATION=+
MPQGNRTIQCSKCKEAVLVKGYENEGAVLREHQSTGKCGKGRERKNDKCSKEECRTREVVRILCQGCGKNYCLKHRSMLDHECGHGSSSSQAMLPGSKKTPLERQLEMKRNAAGAVSASSAAVAKAKANGKQRPAIQPPMPSKYSFANSELYPDGDETIEAGDRFPLSIFFPMSDSTPARHMFFYRKLTVGRMIDQIRDKYMPVYSTNDRMYAFVVRANGFCPLSHVDRLCEIGPDVLRQGDVVVLEVSPSLSPTWFAKLANRQAIASVN